MNRIKAPHSAEISIKNSKFIAYLFPIADVAEAETRLAQVKREHPKARHWCYAYRLGAEEYRCNDDGEPSGTAGLPIYQQLLSFDVSDSLAVVVRYFGGILLGTGGLIKAYKESTRAALQTAELEVLIPQIIFRATADYAQMSTLYNYCQRAIITASAPGQRFWNRKWTGNAGCGQAWRRNNSPNCKACWRSTRFKCKRKNESTAFEPVVIWLVQRIFAVKRLLPSSTIRFIVNKS